MMHMSLIGLITIPNRQAIVNVCKSLGIRVARTVEVANSGREKMIEQRHPKISVIMVDGSFRESFHSLDYFGTQSLSPDDFELLWIEYYDNVHPELVQIAERYSNFRIITLNRRGAYHSSYCFNAGIVASRGELLIIPDADVMVETDFIERIWEDHQENESLVMYVYRYDEMEGDHLPKVDLQHLRDVCVLTNPSNFGGCLTVRRKWLLEINGYEQHLLFSSGFHANGYDVYTRLKCLGLHVKWHPRLKLYHLWHPNTLVDSANYKSQRIMIEYRARNLMSTAFEGIDSERNVDMPDDLIETLSAIEREAGINVRGLQFTSKVAASERLDHQVTRRFDSVHRAIRNGIRRVSGSGK